MENEVYFFYQILKIGFERGCKRMLYSGLLSLTKILFLIECDSKHTIKSTKSIKVEGDSKDPNYISFLISTIKSANRCNERFIEFQTGVIKLHCCIIIKFKYICRDYDQEIPKNVSSLLIAFGLSSFGMNTLGYFYLRPFQIWNFDSKLVSRFLTCKQYIMEHSVYCYWDVTIDLVDSL